MFGKYTTDWRENANEIFRVKWKSAKNLLGGGPNHRWEYNVKMCSKNKWAIWLTGFIWLKLCSVTN
jgi:hypothetical protein